MANVIRRVHGRPTGATGALTDGVRRLVRAYGCASVFGFLLGRDGRLRLKATLPHATAAPGALGPDEAPELFGALYADAPARLDPGACAVLPRTGAVCVAIPLRGPDGPAGVAVATFVRDVDEHMLAHLAFAGEAIAADVQSARRIEALERRLRASQRTAKHLVSGVIDSAVACFVVDLDGRVVRWGRGARERFGHREADLRGRRLPVADTVAERLRLDLRAGAATEEPFPLEIDIAHVDGGTVRVEGIGVAVSGEEESATAVLVVCRQAEAADEDGSLRQAYLASLVERELASPLTAIKGYAELLSRTSIAEDPAQRDRVTRALAHRAREIERLLKDLAVLAGLERASGLIVEVADLYEIVAQAASRVNAEHGKAVLLVEEPDAVRSVLVDRLSAAHALESLFRCIARVADHDDPVRVTVRTEQQAVVVTLDPPPGAAEEVGGRSIRRAGPAEQVLTESGVGFHLARVALEVHGGDLRLEPAAAAVIPRIELRLPLHDGPEEASWLVPMM